MIILPMASFSIISVLFISGVSIFNIIRGLVDEFVKIQTVGFNFHWAVPSFDWFYVNTELIALVGIVIALGSFTMILMSKRMSEGGFDLGLDLIYYLALYMFIAPLWIGKAVFNAMFGVKTSWR